MQTSALYGWASKGSASHTCFPVTPQLIHPQRATIKNSGKTPYPIPESPSEDTQPLHIPIPTDATLVTQYSSLSEHFLAFRQLQLLCSQSQV